MKLLSFKDFLFEAKKKKDDEVEVDVTKAQQAYYKDLPKSTAQKKKAQISKQADMDSDDPSAYKELPGDKKAQRQGKVKTSKYTDAYHKKYGKKEESVDEAEKKYKKGDKLKVKLKNGKEFDITFDSYSSNKGIAFGKIDGDKKPFSLDAVVNEAEKKDDGKPDEELLKAGPIKNPDIEKALKKKQEESGVDIKILRAVMRKGMAAWKAGHRPGATQEQWGYARVNSFLTGGKTIGTKANPGPDGRLGKMAKLI